MQNNMEKNLETKLLIIGGGPSGLSLAYTLSKFSSDFLLVEMGKPVKERDRDDKFSCLAGIGGAGLFSDGKFSFFPSGTHIWKVKDKDCLEKAYRDLQNLFHSAIDFEVPSFPGEKEIAALSTNSAFELKSYPSFYISLDDRLKLVDAMTKSCVDNILLGWKVLDWGKNDDKYRVTVEVEG